MGTNTETQNTADPFQCDKCERTFHTKPALTMHKIRAHGKGWSTSGNFRHKGKQTPQQRRDADATRKRRNYQKKLRARYKQEGKDSRGYRKQHYVYPLPTEQNTQTIRPVEGIKHCPYCGVNIEKHL